MQIGKRVDTSVPRRNKVVAEIIKINARRERRRDIAAGLIEVNKPSTWEWNEGPVTAYTRSEAKARIKDILGQPNRRLPSHIKVTKCTNPA